MQEKVIPVAAGLDPNTAPKRLKLEFAYDAQHRRVMKRVKEWAGDSVTGGFTNVVKDRRYVYDGWNMIAESSRGTEARWTDGAADCPAGVRARAERPNQFDHTTATGTGLAGATVVRTQVWGQDLSGTMQGAGGVGGLLAVRHGGQTYVPLMDGNGNVMGLQGLGGAKDGQTVARYDYDAFGNRITNTAPELGEEVNPFGFSTKFTDEETGLVYYGYRYYAPEVGRWLNRDPIGERGGINLYGMVGNDAVNQVDYLGKNSLIVKGWEGTHGPCGYYQVKFLFRLGQPDVVDGFIVQEITQTEEIDGEPKRRTKYYEAWHVKAGSVEPEVNTFLGYTDASIGVFRPGTCGKTRQDGVIRYYRKGATGDLGSVRPTNDPNNTNRLPGLDAHVGSSGGANSDFQPGNVPNASDMPATYNRPSWWGSVLPIASERRSVTVAWSCPGTTRSKNTIKFFPR